MATITFPVEALPPASWEFGLRSNTQTFTSPLTGGTKTKELPGARWYGTASWENLTSEQSAVLEAFRIAMRGRANRSQIANYSRLTPRGAATGTGLVKGASQTGNTLLTDGWAPSVTNLFLPGDFISVNGEFKMVVEATNSNGAGEATLKIEPPLRSSPADNAPITINSPKVTIMLDDDKQTWNSQAPVLTRHSFSFTEAFE